MTDNEKLTPHDAMQRCLRDALALLSRDSRADELCDRIVGLLEPGCCRYRDCKERGELLVGYREGWSHGEPDVEGAARGDLVSLCHTHADVVTDNGSPEYVESCPNCGCAFGVN